MFLGTFYAFLRHFSFFDRSTFALYHFSAFNWADAKQASMYVSMKKCASIETVKGKPARTLERKKFSSIETLKGKQAART